MNNLKNQIDELHPWFYPVRIGGIQVKPGINSTWDAERLTNRIIHRKKLLVDEVIARYNFENKSILDLGCNCGYWSSIYASLGAKSIVGVEGRKEVIKQAYLYWNNSRRLRNKNYEFLLGNVSSNATWEKISKKKYDFVLCAGLLYHVPNYREILDNINKVVKEVVVIDTRVVTSKEKVIDEAKDLCFNAIAETRKKIVPNLNLLLDYIKRLGFLPELLPVKFITPNGLTGNDDYNKKNRVALFCKKVQK